MPYIEFGCMPTVIGSMPHTDHSAACAQVVHYLKDIPVWPQLPKRSFLEDMNVQHSEGFPGVVVDIEQKRIQVDRKRDIDRSLEQLYAAFLANDVDRYPVTREYARGLHQFLSFTTLTPKLVKGQVTGPVTFGMNIVDENRKGIIYDDLLGDAVPKLLKLKAAWQEKQLKRMCKDTIIFLDEPYMSSFGSVALMLSREKIVALLDEVFSGISGFKGVHCCGNTDWSVLLATTVDIINFDAYNYATSLSLYPTEVKKFLGRNGAIAWGIVPNTAEALAKESVASLQDRLEEAMAPFTRQGIPFKTLIVQGLLTPSCGLVGLPGPDASARALELLTELSARIRKKYV
jgi:methionine synthase II (cobalamin-independent)